MAQLFNLIVKAVADLFDTDQGRALLAQLIAYIQAEMAKEGTPPITPTPTGGTSPAPNFVTPPSPNLSPRPTVGQKYGG